MAAIAVLFARPPASRATRSTARPQWREQRRDGARATRRSAGCAAESARGRPRRPTSTARWPPRCAPATAAGAARPASCARRVDALCREVAAAASDAARRRRVRARAASTRDRTVAEIERPAPRGRALPAAARARSSARCCWRSSAARRSRCAARARALAALARQHAAILRLGRRRHRHDRPRGPRHLRQPGGARELIGGAELRRRSRSSAGPTRRSRATLQRRPATRRSTSEAIPRPDGIDRRSSTTRSRRCVDGDRSSGATVVFRDVSERARAARRDRGRARRRRACWPRRRASRRPRRGSRSAVCAALGWEVGGVWLRRRRRAADAGDVVAARGDARGDPRRRRRPRDVRARRGPGRRGVGQRASRSGCPDVAERRALRSTRRCPRARAPHGARASRS